jgi:hypothetical protein
LYEITWHNAPSTLPLLTVQGSFVEAAWVPFPTDPSTVRTPFASLPTLPVVDAVVDWQVPSIPVRGTFTLSLGGWVTAPISWDATSARMKQALEALPTVDTVAVHRSTAPDGYTWLVTVLDPPGNLPLLAPNASGLTGVAPAALTAEVVPGLGNPEVHAVRTRAIHVNLVQDITAVGRTGRTLAGAFALSLSFAGLSDSGGDVHAEDGVVGPVAMSNWIDSTAVASVSDEALGGGAGRGPGESVQAKVRGLLAKAAAATPPGPLHDIIAAMDCSVVRIAVNANATANASAGFRWRVTLLNAPAPLPLFTLADANFAANTTLVAGPPVGIALVVADNHVFGTFSLVVRGMETTQVSGSVCAQMVRLRAALLRASFVAASAASLSCWTPLAAPPTSPP